eukprot:TRINITY_DN63098_c0_g1_i1.p1 TRINITY_DN63098_c0_g1~~TRINITY_DN63098_c0_g1_i1.p1  ORF type:complete len:1081 (+),score=122.35 TRINITY_DN63098_c0_g1_i1:158-3400(+)
MDLVGPAHDSNNSGATLRFNFGKHRGKTFKDVRLTCPDYCAWALRVDRPYGDLAKFVLFLQSDCVDGSTVANNGSSCMGRQVDVRPSHEPSELSYDIPSDKLSNRSKSAESHSSSYGSGTQHLRSASSAAVSSFGGTSCTKRLSIETQRPQLSGAHVALSHGGREVVFFPGSIGLRGNETGLVIHVEAGGQAERAGVQVGWIIRTVDQKPFTYEGLKCCVFGARSYGVVFSKSHAFDIQRYPDMQACGLARARDHTLPLAAEEQRSSRPPATPCSRSSVHQASSSCGIATFDLGHEVKSSNAASAQTPGTLNPESHFVARAPDVGTCAPIGQLQTTMQAMDQACHDDQIKNETLQYADGDDSIASSTDSPVEPCKQPQDVQDFGSSTTCGGKRRRLRRVQMSPQARAHTPAPASECVASSDQSSRLVESREDHEAETFNRNASLSEQGISLVPAIAQPLFDLSSAAKTALLDQFAGAINDDIDATKREHVLKSIANGCTNLNFMERETTGSVESQSEAFKSLKTHQRVGVCWLLALHSKVPGMILADEMGLGKTLQTLCFIEALSSERPSLIVAPASLLGNWEAEAAKWTPNLRVLKYHASNAERRHELLTTFFEHESEFRLVITTAQTLHNKQDRELFFRRVLFEYLVVDEAHGLKNPKTARYKDLLRHVACRRRLLLTGTPVQNSLAELGTLLSFALSNVVCGKSVGFDVPEAFDAIVNQSSAQSLQLMQALSGPLILRRLKSDVLQSLPSKRVVVVWCDMEQSQRKQYDQELTACRKAYMSPNGLSKAFFSLRRVCLHPLLGKRRLRDEQRARLVTQLIQVRPDFRNVARSRVEKEVEEWNDFVKHQASVDYNLDAEFKVRRDELMDSIKAQKLLEILAQQGQRGDKTLVFSQFTQLLDITQAVLEVSDIGFRRLDGAVAIDERQSLASEFQGGDGPLVFLISTKAGGVGLNLTAANVVVMLDLDFNPQNTRQAEDRVHRLGQTREVTIYYIVCRETVEELVLKRNVSKMHLDQQFGGRQDVLEATVSAGAGMLLDDGDTCQHAEGDGVQEAKECERFVLAELGRILGEQLNPDEEK